MALLLAAAQAVAMEADDSETDNLTIQEDDENEDGVQYHKKEELKLRDELTGMKMEIDDKGTTLSETFSDLSNLLAKYHARLSAREDLLHIRECEKSWSEKADKNETDNLKTELLEKERLLLKYENDLKITKSILFKTQNELEKKISHVTQKEGELTSLQNDLRALHSELVRTQGQLSLKDTLHEKLQSQMLDQTTKYKKEISQLQTALCRKKSGMSLSVESSEQISQNTFDNAIEASLTVSDINQSQDESTPQQDDQTIRIKQEPLDPDDQIIVENNQTKQVTVLNSAPVITSAPVMTNVPVTTNMQKVVPVSVRSTNTNPSSMVTVYVQSTPTVPSVQPPLRRSTRDKLVISTPTRLSTEPDPNQEFLCGRCGKRFIEWLQLQKHLETHSGSRPYKCKFCDKTFRQKYVLDTHIRTHTGERPYKCDQCLQSFGQKATLLNHMRTHTGEKPYLCEYCDKSFAQLSSLSAHARTHTEKESQLFTCEHCGSILADRTGYLRHLRTIHKINVIEELKPVNMGDVIKPVHLLALASQGSPLQVPTSPTQDLSNDGEETE